MTRRTTRKRAPLNRDRVLRAALELADEGGIGALTMQRIGRRLGVEAMSLYRHVRNKDDILDGIVDLVFAEIELPADRSSWRTGAPGRSISARAALRRHPWAITLMESRMAPGPATLRSRDDDPRRPARRGVLRGDGDARPQHPRQLRVRVRAPGGAAAVQQRRGAGERGRGAARPGAGRHVSRASCACRRSSSRPASTTATSSSSVSTSSSRASSGRCGRRDRQRRHGAVSPAYVAEAVLGATGCHLAPSPAGSTTSGPLFRSGRQDDDRGLA